MIISDKYRFVFIHIPKCAGSTVRKQIDFLDDTDGFFSSKVSEHKKIGRIDYAHIPLFILEKYFPEEYLKIKEYITYAVVRNPFNRFPSSVSQHLEMYGDKPIHKLKRGELKEVIDNIINDLSKKGADFGYLPPEYIHFQKQVDFIFNKNEKLVEQIYTPSEFSLLMNKLNEQTEGNLNTFLNERKNMSMVYRNEFIQFLMEDIRPSFKKIYTPLLPEKLKKVLLNNFYVSRDARYQFLFHANYVTQFIEEYYKDDIVLYNKVNNKNSIDGFRA